MMQRSAIVVLCLVMAGCQRLNDQRTVKLDAGAYSIVTIDPANRQQEVVVDFQAGEPVNVYLFLDKDRAAAERTAEREKAPEQSLKKSEGTKQGSLAVTVPAKESLCILLMGAGGATEVKLHSRAK